MSSSRVVLLAVLIAVGGTAGIAAGTPVALEGLRTSVNSGATTIFMRIGGPVQFTPIWVDARTYALDVVGVSTTLASQRKALDSPLVDAYRVFSYDGVEGKPHVRLELVLKSEANVDAHTVQGGLAIKVHQEARAQNTPPSQPQSAPPAVASNSNVPPIHEPAPQNSNRGTAIKAVQVAKLEGTSMLEVQIAGNGAFQYRTSRLTNPERLVVDIPNAADRIHQKQLNVNVSPLRAVRIGQLSSKPMVSRVVLDLDSKTPFQVRNENNSLVVRLGDSQGQSAAPAAKSGTAENNTRAPESSPELAPEKLIGANPAKPAEAAHHPEPVGNEPAKDGAAALLPPSSPGAGDTEGKATSEPVKPASAPNTAAETQPAPQTQQWKEVPMSSPASASSLAPASSQPAVPSSMSAPVQLAALSEPSGPSISIPAKLASGSNASALAAPLPAPMVTNPPAETQDASQAPKKELAQPNAKPAASGRQPEPATLLAQQVPPPSPEDPQQPAAPAASAPQPYTGEPISVNLKDVDLKDFFRLIHEISGLNIILDPSVSGTVTLVLDNVPWDQAMDIVMRNNSLGKQVEGNVVRIARLTTLEAEEKQRRDLALATEQSQPMITVTRSLSYAKATDMIPTLKKFLTARGDIVPDLRTNTVIITDIPPVIPTIDRLLKTLDRKSLQVEIEARVVSATRSFARDIGVQLAASGLTGHVVLGGTGLVGTSPAAARGTAASLLSGTPGGASSGQPLAVNLPATGPTSGFSFLLTAGNNFALDSIITAAESRGVGQLLSRPKVITQNNVEAVVKQGVSIPVQTTINNTVSIQYIDAVLRLTVTPQITADGTIFLKIDIENTNIDTSIATTPGQFGFDTQAAKTQVLVTNGGTVFFGGVIQTNNSVTEQQVPLLGSVPLVGNLFKHKAVSSSTKELLFFITPKIVES